MKPLLKLRVRKPIVVSLSFVLALAIILFVVMLLFNVTDYGITLASFGASVFMILSREPADSRKIFGAYFVATALGMLCSGLTGSTVFNVALAVVASVIIMTMLGFQHAPALGLAVSMILNHFSLVVDIVVLASLFAILSMAFLIRTLMRNPDQLLKYVAVEEEKIKWKFKKREPMAASYVLLGPRETQE